MKNTESKESIAKKYKVEIKSSAQKRLDELEFKFFDRIDKVILSLRENPRPFGYKKLTAFNGFSIRVGQYRILFTINDTSKEVTIFDVGHRKDTYKRL
jgi:mRNA interferase RelE/StbE